MNSNPRTTIDPHSVGDVSAVGWTGIHHLALVTNDMDTTVRFWHGVLDAPLVATIGTEHFRHYFFQFSPTTTVAFFEFAGEHAVELSKPAGVFDPRSGQFDHLALSLPGEADLLALRHRLIQFGCEVTEVVDHHVLRSIYFTDPNGIALEASWWVKALSDAAPGFADPNFFGDPNPVPALVELRNGGLQRTPTTHLS